MGELKTPRSVIRQIVGFDDIPFGCNFIEVVKYVLGYEGNFIVAHPLWYYVKEVLHYPYLPSFARHGAG